MNGAVATKAEGGFIIFHIGKDITDEEIDDLTRQALSLALQQAKGCCCALAGYDFDERELYQIPEAINLCKRLCDRGFISAMHTSTLMDRDELPQLRRFFGAMEVWAIATGNLSYDGDLEIDKENFDVFLKALDRANQVSNELLPKTTDGQHRTRIRL